MGTEAGGRRVRKKETSLPCPQGAGCSARELKTHQEESWKSLKGKLEWIGGLCRRLEVWWKIRKGKALRLWGKASRKPVMSPGVRKAGILGPWEWQEEAFSPP